MNWKAIAVVGGHGERVEVGRFVGVGRFRQQERGSEHLAEIRLLVPQSRKRGRVHPNPKKEIAVWFPLYCESGAYMLNTRGGDTIRDSIHI